MSSPRRGYGGGAVERGEGYLGPIRSNGRVREHQGGAEDLTEQWLDEEGHRRRRSTCRSEMLGGGDADRLGEGLGVVGGASLEFVAPRRSFVRGHSEYGGVVLGIFGGAVEVWAEMVWRRCSLRLLGETREAEEWARGCARKAVARVLSASKKDRRRLEQREARSAEGGASNR